MVDEARNPIDGLVSTGFPRLSLGKSLPAQEARAMLPARKLVQAKLHDVPVCRSVAPKIRHDGPTFAARRVQTGMSR